MTRQIKDNIQTVDNQINEISSNGITSTQPVLNRSLEALKLGRQEGLEQVAIQRTGLQETENTINNEAELVICHIVTVENPAIGHSQQPHQISLDTYYPSNYSQHNDSAQEEFSTIHRPVVAHPRRQTLSGFNHNLSQSDLPLSGDSSLLITLAPIARDSRIRNIMMRKTEGLITQTSALTRGCIQPTRPPTTSSYTTVGNLLQGISHFKKGVFSEESHLNKEKRSEVDVMVTPSMFLRPKTLRPRSCHMALEQSILIKARNTGSYSHCDMDYSTMDRKDTWVGMGNCVFQSTEVARRANSV